MNVSHRYPARLVLAIAAALAVLVVGAATASGQDVPSSDQASGGGGVSGTTGSTGVDVGTAIAVSPDYPVASGIAMPEWCCGGATGYVPGLTTYGQATVDGQDPADRDAAIAVAVQDATAQATAAADAAGITLGAIIDMQVSAMPYYAYPMMGVASGSSGSSPGSPGGGGMEPAPAPDMYLGSVSVTITWSLG